jgi:integrase
MTNSTRTLPKKKPSKPYRDFPLFAHGNGQWCKKIRGRHHFFGLWSDPEAALRRYLDQKDDLHAGRTPRANRDGVTVRDLVIRYLTWKRHLADTREITERTFADYYASCERITKAFGLSRMVEDLHSQDFEQLRIGLAKTWGPATLANEVQRVRSLFKYAYDAALIDKPIRFGPGFKRPSRKALRRARTEKGNRMFEAREIKVLLARANVPMRAMILLGVNCGFGNQDCGTLPKSALDLKGGWVNYPRPKTAVMRRVPLWPETVSALKEAIRERPEPKKSEHDRLIFITKEAEPWAKEDRQNPLAKEMAKLLKRTGLSRPGLSFYALRRALETIGGESLDQVAVDAIMGHAPEAEDMSAVYRQRISDERLRVVTDYVRRWLDLPTAGEPAEPILRIGG